MKHSTHSRKQPLKALASLRRQYLASRVTLATWKEYQATILRYIQ